MSFSNLPADASAAITPFELSIPQAKVDEMHNLLNVSKIAPKTYENSAAKETFGITHDWLTDAVQHWSSDYNWRDTERHINSFPNFKAKVQDDDGSDFDVHFVALFSGKKDAVPLLMTHGWPGSFLEFLPLLTRVQSQYSPSTLPYHLIVPSIPGYTLSSGPPLDRNFTFEDIARVLHRLMLALGFGESGYVAQGGDIGSRLSQILGQEYQECKAVHVNVIFSPPPEPAPALSPPDQAVVERNLAFRAHGFAYAQMHGTRPATAGFVLQSSPVALLSWIGEKFLAWTDEDPPLRTILDSVSLYWLTETIARCLYPYRAAFPRDGSPPPPAPFLVKPLGFSSFAKELYVTPKPWAEKIGQLEFYRDHASGGHFAALEKPKELWEDVEEFIGKVWKA